MLYIELPEEFREAWENSSIPDAIDAIAAGMEPDRAERFLKAAKGTINTELIRVMQVANTSHEVEILDDLVLAAGIRWRCEDEECGWNNHWEEDVCDGCGGARPKPRVEPPWDELDPGIAHVVRILWEHGYSPTDSGDGVTKFLGDPDRSGRLRVPYVFCVSDHETHESLREVVELLGLHGVKAHAKWSISSDGDDQGRLYVYPVLAARPEDASDE